VLARLDLVELLREQLEGALGGHLDSDSDSDRIRVRRACQDLTPTPAAPPPPAS
jgi:hypothetical protein